MNENSSFTESFKKEKKSSNLVVVILGGAARVKTEVETASTRYVHRVFKFVVIPHWMNSFHCFPSSPWGRDLQAGQKAWLLSLFQNLETELSTT